MNNIEFLKFHNDSNLQSLKESESKNKNKIIYYYKLLVYYLLFSSCCLDLINAK